MILKLNQNEQIKEPEVQITYAQMNEEVERVATFVRTLGTTIRCKSDGKETYIPAADIYYFESVDKKSFVYCEKDVYQTELRLYELEEQLGSKGFARINKACILNLAFLDSIRPLPSSRLEATLKNDEKLFVSRKYLGEIKSILQRRSGL